MRKFVFRLQSVLNLRLAKENALLGELAALRRELQSQQDLLAALLERRELAMRQGRLLRREGPEPPRDARFLNYLERLDEDVETQRQAVACAEAAVEAKLQEVLQAMKARKSLENIRERQSAAHARLAAAEEMKALDEFAALRSARGG